MKKIIIFMFIISFFSYFVLADSLEQSFEITTDLIRLYDTVGKGDATKITAHSNACVNGLALYFASTSGAPQLQYNLHTDVGGVSTKVFSFGSGVISNAWTKINNSGSYYQISSGANYWISTNQTVAGGASTRIYGDTVADLNYSYTADAGASWSAPAGAQIAYRLYTITCPGGNPESYFNVYAKDNRTLNTITNFTAILTNETDGTSITTSVTNGTASFNLGPTLHNYSLNISSGGYALFNVSLQNINGSSGYTAYLQENNTIQVNIYDIKTLSKINFTNITFEIIGNITGYYDSGEIDNGSLYYNNLDADTYIFNFEKENVYPKQSFYVTLLDNEYKDLDVYLTNSSYLVTTNINIIDPYGENIEGAVLTAQQNIEGSYITISQKTTDATGRASFYLTRDETFKIIIEKTGYTTRIATITPTSDPYDATLKISLTNLFNFSSNIYGITYAYNPLDLYINKTIENTSFILFTSSPYGTLSYFGVQTKHGIVNITGSVSGGTANLTLNLSNETGLYNVSFFFKVSGEDLFLFNKSYQIKYLNYTNYSLIQSYESETGEISALWKVFIITLSCIFFLFVLFEIGLPVLSYGFAVTAVFIFYTAIGWLNWYIPVISGILAVGGLISLGGGYSG